MMSRLVLVVPALLVGFAGAGCANFIESRAIHGFAAALESKNLDRLKARSSEQFEHKALRMAEALDDFKILRLPDGKASVVKVEDVDDDEKNVTVEVGERKRKVLYKLVKDAKTKKWVVDDIYLNQKKDGVTATRTVTEQMDLLISVREFLSAWGEGDRERILELSTDELSAVLAQLPPEYLSQMTGTLTAQTTRSGQHRPEAHLDGEVAVVRVPRPSGDLTLRFAYQLECWKVADVAIESRDDKKHVPSLEKTSRAMLTAMQFLQAYAAADRKQLAEACTPKLFNKSLKYGDPATVPLPGPDDLKGKFDITLNPNGADLVINGADAVVRIDMQRDEKQAADKPAEFRVEDVTIYEMHTQQNKKLSSVFTASAVVGIYAEALAQRNLPVIRQMSTQTFNRAVWKRVDDELMQFLPLAEIEPVPVQVVSTDYQGSMTQVTVHQGRHTLTYIVHDRGGDVSIDDVIVPVPGRPYSLKQLLDTMLPVANFIRAIERSDLKMLTVGSSDDFNRMVWNQANQVDSLCFTAADLMRTSIARVEEANNRIEITFGDDQRGAEVTLIREREKLLVDEIVLVGDTQPDARMPLKKQLRMMMADSQLAAEVRGVRAVNRPAVDLSNAPQRISVAPHVATQPYENSGVPQEHSAGPPVIEPSDTAFTPPEQ